MSKKLLLLVLLLAVLILPVGFRNSSVQAIELVDVSTRFIDAAPGSSGGPVRLAATLYQPRFFPSAPAVIYIHGWGGRRLTGEDNLAYYIAAAGYIVLSYTARGFGDGESGGRATLAGPDELDDLSRVIDWLKNDPDNAIGPRVTKIGVIGGSYGGGHSFQIASDPRVSAVVPLVGWTDLEQALYPNGAINYRLGIAEFTSGLDRQVGSPPFFNYSQILFEMFDAGAEGRVPDEAIIQALRARSIARRNEAGQAVIDPMRQPRAAIYIIQSWDDYLFPSTQVLDVYSQITAPKQIYMGRSGHPPGGQNFEGEELYIATQVLRWFDRYLRGFGGKDSRSFTSATAPLPALPFAARDYPTDDVGSKSLFLKADGTLAKKKKGADLVQTAGGIFRPERIRSSHLGADIPSQSDMLSGRVEELAATPRRLEYTSAPWQTDIEMIGPSEFSIFVSSATSQSFDLVVRTYDVAPDGTETEVTVGVMRVNSLAPGEIWRVRFRDYGDDWVFRAGHSVRLKLSNIDFPTFRPPGANDNIASEVTIHTGKHFPSKIVLPVRIR